MIKNYFQLVLKLTLILFLLVSSLTVKSQNTNYFEASKNIEIFTDLYKELHPQHLQSISKSIDKIMMSLMDMGRKLKDMKQRKQLAVALSAVSDLRDMLK